MFKIEQSYWGEYLTNNYYVTHKLESGQTIKIVFYEEWSNTKYYYSIYLVTSDKRSSESSTYMKETGKDGLKGLLWAKNKIKEFEDFISKEKDGIPVVIYCRWDDNRRRNEYARGLKDLGYTFNMVFGKKALCKTLNN